MNTLSVRLRYRPVRLGWCIATGDKEAYRRAVRTAFVLWGGRYNPFIPVDQPDLAEALVREYRVDALVPVSDTPEVKAFIEAHPHLPWPGLGMDVFSGGMDGRRRPHFADISHPIDRIHQEYVRNNPSAQVGLNIYEWDESDPLSDIFLPTFGGVPSATELGFDYAAMAQGLLIGQKAIIQKDGQVPPMDIGRDTLASLNTTYMSQHYAIQNHWNRPGLYVGRADDFDDLITFWNLRAANVELLFHDPQHAERLALLNGPWADRVRGMPPGPVGREGLGLWHRRSDPIADTASFGQGLTICAVDEVLWNGLNLKAPIMHFGEATALAAVGESGSKTAVSFALSDRPFRHDVHASDQRYVVSVDPGIGLSQSERSTLHLPFVPALNEFYGRNAYFIWNSARAEPDSLGIIDSIGSNDLTLHAVDVTQLVTEIFKSLGIDAAPSRAGLVGASLIRQMGGLQGCRPFKIAGVRQLIENHRPEQGFSRSDALQAIRGQGGTTPIENYKRLFIEPRPFDHELTGEAVLGYLLDKEVFRAGLSYDCPSCQLEFWLSLDDAKSHLECEYCGHGFNGSRQLKDRGWAFRRSGLFGRADHQEGAIPVVLTLQQLTHATRMQHGLYTMAMALSPAGASIPKCETDFVMVANGSRDGKIEMAIGECKTRKEITKEDVRNLGAVADAFPSDQFDVYIVFSRLTPFTDDEADLIKTLNDKHRLRVIMLTERELEPYFTYEQTQKDFDIRSTAVSFRDMAEVTDRVFFKKLRRSQSEAETSATPPAEPAAPRTETGED